MCSQRVTLTVELCPHRVECPRCHHRESGSVFLASETPVAVLLVDAGRLDPATIALPATHDPDDMFAGQAPEERTHLLLDAESVSEAEPRLPPPQAPPAKRRREPEDERTHLLLDPVDLQDEPEPGATPGPARPAAAGPMLRLGRVLDEVLHDRWCLALALVALVCGVLPPIVDGLGDTEGAGMSLVASFTLLLGLGVYVLAWLSRSPLGSDPGQVVRRVQAAVERLRHDVSELRHSPRYLQLVLLGQLLTLLGLAGLTSSSGLSLLRWPFGSYDPPSLFRLLSGLLALAGAALLFSGDRAAPAAAPGPDDFAESVAAAGHLPPVVDLDEPLPASFIGGYTTFHKALVVMSQWRGPTGPDEQACRSALARHLQRHLSGSRVDSERWLGPRRSDGVAALLIDGMIRIEVRRGFQGPDADQALASMRAHVRRWADKPMILCVFDAPRRALFEGSASAALVELHEAAPFVTARMPTRR